MNKKYVFVFLIIFSVFIGIIVYVQSKKQGVQTPKSSTLQAQPAPIDENSNLKKYSDPSGFSFSVSKNLSVTTKQSTDQSVYSDLQILSPQNKGSISIKAVASDLATVEAYFKTSKLITKETKVDTLKLADLDARRFTIGNQANIIALDKGVLFTITIDSLTDKNFWEDVNNTIIKSFTFALPDTQVSSGSNQGSSEDNGVVEEEEVIE